MFGAPKGLWNQSGITASVDGVLREVSNGNAVEVQKWYFKLKKQAYKSAQELGITPDAAEERAFATMPLDKLVAYRCTIGKLRLPGCILAEIDEWLKTNDPI